MRKCSVINCGFRKDGIGTLDINHPNVILHRLPKCEMRKKKWIDSLGVNNLKLSNKAVFICSLHFHQSCFSKETNNVTLYSNAVPSQVVPAPVLLPSSNTNMSIKTEGEHCETSSLELVQPCCSKIMPNGNPTHTILPRERVNTQGVIKTLKNKCVGKQQIIKKLKEIIRQKTKKIENLTDIVANLKKQLKAEQIVILKECAGHKDFLK